MFGALFEVLMSKKCTPLWRKADLEVKMHKTPHVRSTFGSSDVENMHAVVAKSTFGSENVKSCSPRSTFRRSDVAKLHAAVARTACGSENVQKL